MVLDQHSFPRPKPCAGWIIPAVVRDLQLNIPDYPHSFTTFRQFVVSIRGWRFRLPTRQYAIRRIEFDDWLLRRSGAPFYRHQVKTITPGPGGYTLDGEFSGKYLVGAGGTSCPVYRSLFKAACPRLKESQVVALEEEFAYEYNDERCHLWFLENGLPGYAWYVPKAGGVVNVGVGGTAARLVASGDSIQRHWGLLVENLERLGLVRGRTYRPSAYTYYTRLDLPEIRRGNAFLVGDAAGLATEDLGEGIGPAIRSGLLAAEAILHGGEYRLASIPRVSRWAILRS